MRIREPLITLGLLAVLALPCFTAPALAQDTGALDKEKAAKAYPAKPPYSPYAGRNYPTRPLFGDTHLHTSFSMDAGAFGARLTPRDAYRFARGEEVIASSGQPAKLSRPLDFLVVADHSDGMGFFPLLLSGDPKILADSQGRRWSEMIRAGQGQQAAWMVPVSMVRSTSSSRPPERPQSCSRACRPWPRTVCWCSPASPAAIT
jgi:hypothetical protein